LAEVNSSDGCAFNFRFHQRILCERATKRWISQPLLNDQLLTTEKTNIAVGFYLSTIAQLRFDPRSHFLWTLGNHYRALDAKAAAMRGKNTIELPRFILRHCDSDLFPGGKQCCAFEADWKSRRPTTLTRRCCDLAF